MCCLSERRIIVKFIYCFNPTLILFLETERHKKERRLVYVAVRKMIENKTDLNLFFISSLRFVCTPTFFPQFPPRSLL